MEILVSHPGKQYVHQLLYGLKNFGKLTFHTSYWYQPGKFPYNILETVPFPGKKQVFNQLKKRYFDSISDIEVVQYPMPEMKRLALTKLNRTDGEEFVFRRDRAFDKKVARQIGKLKSVDLVIGYEMACLETFKAAKLKGATTVLDLAQIHYKEIDLIGQQYPAFGKLFENRTLRDEINQIKQQELDLADYIICLSEFAKASLVKNGIPKEKIFKLNIGFDPMVFHPKKNYHTKNRFKFVFVGTLTSRKGIDLVVKAFEDFKNRDCELLIIGPPGDALPLVENKENIQHISFLDHSQLNEYLKESDVFVFPSYLDSWAMVVIEAMACGLPAIVSNKTGAADAVRTGGGHVIEPSLKELSASMEYFYNNRLEVERIGKEARMVAERYTWQAYRDQLNLFFQKMRNDSKRI